MLNQLHDWRLVWVSLLPTLLLPWASVLVVALGVLILTAVHSPEATEHHVENLFSVDVVFVEPASSEI